MRLRSLCFALLACAPLAALAQESATPRVLVHTNRGDFVIELDRDRAPLTVANFLEYVRGGQYSGTIFHRVIANFVAQGGGYDESNTEKKTRPGIPNESGNGLPNRRGAVGLARSADPHSGTAQFYVNLADNGALDPQPSRWGYAVFGHVVQGMEVVDDIGAVATGQNGPFESDAPLKPVVIIRVEEMK